MAEPNSDSLTLYPWPMVLLCKSDAGEHPASLALT